MAQQTWFITGISSGFGRSLSELLLERGDRVAGTVRKHDAVTDLQERYPELLWLGVLDVTDVAAVHEVVDRAFAHWGRIDVVVNNAGGPPPGDFRDWDRDTWIAAIDPNMLTAIFLIKATVDGMIERKFGRVVNITSSAVKAPIR